MNTNPTDPTLAVILAGTGGEREVLEAFLDFHRAVVIRKVRGVSEEDARHRWVPSMTTLAGLLKHLTVVERNWFRQVLSGSAAASGTDTGPDGETESWILDPRDTVDELIAGYDRACAESRQAAAGLSLDHAVPCPGLGQLSLRWIYTHMIEETARHAGHADILRELTDGRTGTLG